MKPLSNSLKYVVLSYFTFTVTVHLHHVFSSAFFKIPAQLALLKVYYPSLNILKKFLYTWLFPTVNSGYTKPPLLKAKQLAIGGWNGMIKLDILTVSQSWLI